MTIIPVQSFALKIKNYCEEMNIEPSNLTVAELLNIMNGQKDLSIVV